MLNMECLFSTQEDPGKGIPMMGAEPLEVPHQSSATEHQHQQTSLIPPSTLVEDGCWDTSSNTNKLANLSHHQVNGGQSQGSSSSSSGAKGARRTRHRVGKYQHILQ
jgi:hypothetical protein